MVDERMFIGENGQRAVIRFSITEDMENDRSYGISVYMRMDSGEDEHKEVRRIFYTYKEAEKTAEMLARHGVTPCVLGDIIHDLF